MTNKDAYEVERADYQSFCEQLRMPHFQTEMHLLEDDAMEVQLISRTTGRCVAGRIYDPRELPVEQLNPQRYFIFETPLPEESRAPIPKTHLHLETREEVQAFFDAISRLQKAHDRTV